MTYGVLQPIENARERRLPWPLILDTIANAERSGSTDREGRLWISLAAAASGYNANQIRQAQRTYRTLRGLLGRSEDDKILENLTYSHLEIIARIAKLDNKEAMKYLADGNMLTYRDLRYQYDVLKNKIPQLVSTIASGRLSWRKFQVQCQLVLERVGSPLSNDARQLQVWPGRFRYARPSFVGVVYGSGKIIDIDGYSCCMISNSPRDERFDKYTMRIATESTFFRKYIILIPPWGEIAVFDEICEELNLSNIGVVEINLKDDKLQIRKIPSGLPTPDRRHILLDRRWLNSSLQRHNGTEGEARDVI